MVSLSTDGYDLGQVDLVARGDGAYTANLILPAAGDGEVRTSVRLDEFANPVASVTVPVAGNGR